MTDRKVRTIVPYNEMEQWGKCILLLDFTMPVCLSFSHSYVLEGLLPCFGHDTLNPNIRQLVCVHIRVAYAIFLSAVRGVQA